MNNQSIAYKFIAATLTLTISMLPVHGYAADGIAQVGKDAQDLGNEMANSFKGASGTVQNGQITLPTIKDGKFDTSGQASFNVNELFPGTSTPNNLKHANTNVDKGEAITFRMPIIRMWTI